MNGSRGANVYRNAWCFALMLMLAVACGGSAAQDQLSAAGMARGWRQLQGDLPINPDVKLGSLPNGMRYVIQTSKAEAGRAAMRLAINAGSMHETPDQGGVAHFLEHMAFHGSKNVADGEVQKSLERLGLRMGPDTNATTSQDRTIYKFNLARNNDASIDTGLMLLREIASELNLDPALMEKERGIVLAEISFRDGPARAARRARLARQLGDHPYVRPTSGSPETIGMVSVQQMRAFYDAFYRPERAVVVVVGDVDPAAVEARIIEEFSNWSARGEPGRDPAPVTEKPSGEKVAVELIEGAPDIQLELLWFAPYREVPPLTRGARRQQLVKYLGAVSMSNRGSAALEAEGWPARSIGGINDDRILGVWNGRSMRATGVTNAPKTLDLMYTARRQAAATGITQIELDLAIDAARSTYKRAVTSSESASAQMLADIAANNAMSQAAFVSPADQLTMFEEHVPTITLAEVNAALKAQAAGEPILTYRGPTAVRETADVLRAAFATLEKRPAAAAYAEVTRKLWPYTEFGPPGKITERRDISDLGVTFVRFENGVRLTIKPTSYRKNDATLRVRFGLGQLGMPRERKTAADMGVTMWSRGGVKKLTKTEQSLILQRDAIAATPRISADAFILETCAAGCLTPNRVELQLQLVTAMFTDPAWRMDSWTNLMHGAAHRDKSMQMTATAIASSQFPALVRSGDLRWAYATAESRKTWKPEDAIAFMKPIVANSPLEIIVAGDVNVDNIITSVARTLGTLPARKEISEPPGLRDVKPPEPRSEPLVLPHKGPPDQGLAYIVWPTTDMYADVLEDRRRMALAHVMTRRARDRIRHADGISYSPRASSLSDRNLPGFGYISATIDAPPTELKHAIASFEAIAAELANEEMTADEFVRLMKPMLAALTKSREQNLFWIDNLSGAQTNPRALNLLRSIDKDYASITPADIKATAQRWLKPENAWRMTVVPETAVSSGEDEPRARHRPGRQPHWRSEEPTSAHPMNDNAVVE